MGNKRSRHDTILELVRRNHIESQQRLAKTLLDHGIRVSQATLSRDIQQLGLVKIGNRYTTGSGGVRHTTEQALRRMLRDYVVEVDSVYPLLVMKTESGTAAAVADALDSAAWLEIVGTIAGENTIFVLCRSAAVAEETLRRIDEIRSLGT